jgi:hypothetical protein
MKLKFLKKLDIFQTEVQIFSTSRNKVTNEKTYAENHGSVLGGILSIICFLSTSYYIHNLYFDMISGNQDNYNNVLETNIFNNGWNM